MLYAYLIFTVLLVVVLNVIEPRNMKNLGSSPRKDTSRMPVHFMGHHTTKYQLSRQDLNTSGA